MDPAIKNYIQLLLTSFIRIKIHKKGEILNEEKSEELTNEFLNDITEARLIITDEQKSDAKSFIENTIAKHRLLQRQFGIDLLKRENTHIVILE